MTQLLSDKKQGRHLGSAAVASVGDFDVAGAASTAETNAKAASTPLAHSVDLANPHQVTALQAGADATNTAANAVAAIGTVVDLGSVSGAVSLACTPNATHTISLSNDLTSWAFTGLAIGQGCRIIVTTNAHAVATTGLTALNGVSAALTNIAVTGNVLFVLRTGAGTYAAIC